MIRILTVAAVAALIAAPASAQSMRVSTSGKSPEQLHAEIVKAAKTVCARASMGASFPRAMMQTCMKASVEHAVAQSRNPALAAIPTRLASR
ncbi:hypothetical protein [Phenylobacterium sp.]|uniref:hypothetical protein n=1 Tax=Phenylobacterium sp. TaxID=1871053 RepID=UPI002811D0D3|nr:hypothetical protein [Phenylobacterium sp.]